MTTDPAWIGRNIFDGVTPSARPGQQEETISHGSSCICDDCIDYRDGRDGRDCIDYRDPRESLGSPWGSRESLGNPQGVPSESPGSP